MRWNLDWLLGPRNWMVVQWRRGFHALPFGPIASHHTLVKSGLRNGAAQRLARRLKEQARDKPERVS